MEVVYLKSFLNDLKKIKNKKTKDKLKKVILEIKQVQSLSDINNIKKMKGYSIAYRIRMGDYRIGVYIENNKIEFARFISRKDIYKIFP